MTWRTLLAAGALTLALGGCIVESHPPRGDLTLDWIFAGQGCQSAGVASVEVQLFDGAGNGIADDTFPCSQGGATYKQLEIGTYGYDLNGFTAGGTRIYEGSGTVDVHGGSDTYTVNLAIPP